jgi:hypothetical protein
MYGCEVGAHAALPLACDTQGRACEEGESRVGGRRAPARVDDVADGQIGVWVRRFRRSRSEQSHGSEFQTS